MCIGFTLTTAMRKYLLLSPQSIEDKNLHPIVFSDEQHIHVAHCNQHVATKQRSHMCHVAFKRLSQRAARFEKSVKNKVLTLRVAEDILITSGLKDIFFIV